jgi:hypothetical protein
MIKNANATIAMRQISRAQESDDKKRGGERDSAHVPNREADCFALRHGFGDSGKRLRAWSNSPG